MNGDGTTPPDPPKCQIGTGGSVAVFTTGMTSTRTPKLVSVGYEGRDVNDLVAYLEGEGVRVLVDVRLNPISRKPGLSKTRLAEVLRSAGIEYVHKRELGNPKDNRDGFRSGQKEAVDRFRCLLREEAATEALGHVSELLEDEVVALLCFEHEHATCHRGLVTEALLEKVPCLLVEGV